MREPGETKWVFRTVPQADDFGVDTWLNESWRYSGNANVWSMLSVDDELGYVYLPTGSASNDFYGGHRLGDNLFAESLVALDIETGERIWHFQAVHHGLWGLRFPCCAELDRHHGRGPSGESDRPGEQAGLHLRVRPRDRRAGLADRRAPGGDRYRPRRRGGLADPGRSRPSRRRSNIKA